MTNARPFSADPRSIDIDARAREVLAAHPARVQRFEVAGQFYWVKREERLTLRMRIQKGDAHRAFEAERRAMHRLAEMEAPVPEIVAEGPDYFVTPDSGPSLTGLLRDRALSPADRTPAFEAAAAGLASFHARGLSHGRPSIKDICWDGVQARFLDLERFSPRRNTHAGHVQDLVILLFSAFAETGAPTQETEALTRAYRAADPGGIWEGAARFCRRMRWTDAVTWPIQRFLRKREFKAIPLTLAAFGADHRSFP